MLWREVSQSSHNTHQNLSALNTKEADKVRMLSRILEIPYSSITERDVIRMIGADTGDIVNTLVRVSGSRNLTRERIASSPI